MVKDTLPNLPPPLILRYASITRKLGKSIRILSDMTMSDESPTNNDSMASSSGGSINRTKRIRAMIATQISKRITNPYKNHPHIKGLKYVIFPNSTKILWWDFLMILVIFYYAFWIPYHFGIEGGYKFLTNKLYFGFHICLDALFTSECSFIDG